MVLSELRELIQGAQWFTRLGQAEGRPGIVAVSLCDWQSFAGALGKSGFNLPHDQAPLEAAPFADMEWLPTSIGQEDPIHGENLTILAREQGREAELKAARLELFKLGQVSLRPVADHAALQVGVSNYNPAARGAALFASRMAASEAVLEVPGFWCSLIALYHDGNWPLGITSYGDVIVL